MERLEAISYGRVQLVMYRDFVQRKAKGLGLCGEVRNLSDGTVSIVAEGERRHLEQLVEKLKRGPLLARVDEVKHSFESATGAHKDFVIVYD
jgi:acylphosphatase